RFEINLRSAAVLGMVGAGGIGLPLIQRLQFRRWAEVSMFIIVIVVFIIVVDAISSNIRRRLVWAPTPAMLALGRSGAPARGMIGVMSDYPEATRDSLLDAAAEVLLATVASDRTGVVAYYREILAAGRYLYDAQRKYAHNGLVSAVFQRTEAPDYTASEEPLTRE